MQSDASSQHLHFGQLFGGGVLKPLGQFRWEGETAPIDKIHDDPSGGDVEACGFGPRFSHQQFGAAPFHMWLPDTYHGAPTPITDAQRKEAGIDARPAAKGEESGGLGKAFRDLMFGNGRRQGVVESVAKQTTRNVGAPADIAALKG